MPKPFACRPTILALLGFCLLLSACGFKLAGTSALPPQLERIHLVTRDFSDRQRDALRARLSRSGATVSLQAQEAAVRLTVSLQSAPDRRLVSSASTGRIVDRLTRRLVFNLRDANDLVLLPSKTLTQRKDIVLDDDNLLASRAERRSVLEDLEQALFNQLIHQLQRI